ncbi:hypothetical protein HU200_022117 [Digitaria exilis]|uniref:MADS-box domain-containing protein n=1 Tax=Digitaria exilis TaxID=1010633 RepID=A0A835EVL9_9POAL|nr:hypothetical protein HU200_022117 [Digitaria exilis]
MPRRKIELGLIEKASSRAKSLKQRKEGLQKKSYELEVLTGVDVAVVCANPGGGAPKLEYGSAAVIDRYFRLPADKRAKHTHLNYLNVELGKEKARLAKERQEGPKALASPRKQEMSGVDLEELLASIDAALLATTQRRKALGMPDVVDGGQPPVDAVVPLGEGVQLVGDDGGFDDDLEAWVDELTWHDVEPHPLNASMMQPAAPADDGAQFYINGVEPRPFNSSMTQPASGVQYISGASLGMGGNPTPPLQQMGGNGGENDHGQLAWGAYPLHNNTVSFPDHSFQYTGSNNSYRDMDGSDHSFQYTGNNNSYADMDGFQYTGSNYYSYADMDGGCPQMTMPSNANAYDGFCNPVYMPPEHSSMGTDGDCFSGVSAIDLDGSSFMDASGHEYETQCLADYFQCPDASQHLGVEPLLYLSDVAEGICYYEHEAGSCSSGGSQPFVQSHSSSGSLQFYSEQSQSDARDQAPGVQKFWAMEEAVRFNQAVPVRCAAS